MNRSPKVSSAPAGADTGEGPETLLYVPKHPAEPSRLQPDGPFPQPFGRYILRERLGRGGMGTVFLADDTVLEVPVALKVPHAHLFADPDTLARFYGEAKAAARLCH